MCLLTVLTLFSLIAHFHWPKNVEAINLRFIEISKMLIPDFNDKV